MRKLHLIPFVIALWISAVALQWRWLWFISSVAIVIVAAKLLWHLGSEWISYHFDGKRARQDVGRYIEHLAYPDESALDIARRFQGLSLSELPNELDMYEDWLAAEAKRPAYQSRQYGRHHR